MSGMQWHRLSKGNAAPPAGPQNLSSAGKKCACKGQLRRPEKHNTAGAEYDRAAVLVFPWPRKIPKQEYVCTDRAKERPALVKGQRFAGSN